MFTLLPRCVHGTVYEKQSRLCMSLVVAAQIDNLNEGTVASDLYGESGRFQCLQILAIVYEWTGPIT